MKICFQKIYILDIHRCPSDRRWAYDMGNECCMEDPAGVSFDERECSACPVVPCYNAFGTDS